MRTRKYKFFVGDFETTVFEGQTYTEVWASACVELYSDDVHIFHSIQEQFDYFCSLDANIICYYHNLKFDGEYWLSYLINRTNIKQALNDPAIPGDITSVSFGDIFHLENNTFCYSISSLGQWYRIMIKVNNKIIEFRDSLKLLPFSVKRIGKAFKTHHQKLDMEYKGFRYAGCEITKDEQEYIKNDVLVIKEAMEIMYDQGHKKLTIGSCCLSEFKKTLPKKTYEYLFPQLYDIPIPEEYGALNAGEWLRGSYRGGWCYAVKGKTHKEIYNGCTADVNSLYPSMMSSESGNRYPVGKPTFWKGNYIPEEAMNSNRYYFVRIKTRFYIKKGYLPFIQIKSSLLYKANESLESSDVFYNGKYYDKLVGFDGKLEDTRVILTLTMTDYELIRKHYRLVNCEILDGCWFESNIGVFDPYINKYKNIKLESTGALRELAKLFLNNLYGKMAAGKNSSYKVAFPDDTGTMRYLIVRDNQKEPGYIAVGAAITSYARRFTITAAQQNYHGPDKPGFIYADTDSIHCDLPPDKIKGITVHPKNFCCWKIESNWDVGFFVRQKTYIEHVTTEDGVPVDVPYYNIKCAGMPKRCKDLFNASLSGVSIDAKTQEEEEFLKTRRSLNDFDVGLQVPSKLIPKRIPGGVVLTETVFTMR